jgi:hypothetical protein
MRSIGKFLLVMFVLALFSVNAYAVKYTMFVYYSSVPTFKATETSPVGAMEIVNEKTSQLAQGKLKNQVVGAKVEYKNFNINFIGKSVLTDSIGIAKFTAVPQTTVKISKPGTSTGGLKTLPAIQPYSFVLPDTVQKAGALQIANEIVLEVGVAKFFNKP